MHTSGRWPIQIQMEVEIFLCKKCYWNHVMGHGIFINISRWYIFFFIDMYKVNIPIISKWARNILVDHKLRVIFRSFNHILIILMKWFYWKIFDIHWVGTDLMSGGDWIKGHKRNSFQFIRLTKCWHCWCRSIIWIFVIERYIDVCGTTLYWSYVNDSFVDFDVFD